MNSYSYNPQEVAAATGDIADTQSPVASTNTNLPPQSSSSYSFNPQEVAQGTNDQAPQSNYLQDVANNPVGRGFLNLAAGVGDFAQGIGNVPYEALHALDQIGPQTNMASYVSPPTNTNYSQYFGINNPDVYDKMVQGAAQYAPYGAASELLPAASASAGLLSKWAGQGLAGSTFGLTQSQNPTLGAIMGGATGVGTGAGGSLVGAGLSGLSNFFSQYAAPGLAKGVSNLVNYGKEVNNGTAFQMTKDNLQNNVIPQETQAWNTATNAATIADHTPSVSYDDSGYTNSLLNRVGYLQKQSNAQSGYARSNSDAIQLLNGTQNDDGSQATNGYIQDNHGTFSNAIQHAKALNQDYQNELTPGKSLPADTVNFAKQQLAQNIQQNLNQNGLQGTLGTSWQNANQITQQKNQVFNQVVNQSGNVQRSNFSNFIKNNTPTEDASTFVKQYIPNGAADGTQKITQFQQMVGDPDYANSVIKSNYFNGNTDPQGFMNKYNNLSGSQQNLLFNPQQNANIQALNTMMAKNPNLFSGSLFKQVWSHSFPSLLAGAGGIAGSAAAHGIGLNDLSYGLGAAALAKGAGLGTSALMRTQPMQNLVVNSLTRQPGVTGQLLKAISQRSAQGLNVPSAVNNQQSIQGSLLPS